VTPASDSCSNISLLRRLLQFLSNCASPFYPIAMSSGDEFDTIPDEFDGFDFDAIPDLAITGPTEVTGGSSSAIPPRPASAGSSSHYSCDDEIDESVLVELDVIEGRLVRGMTTGS